MDLCRTIKITSHVGNVVKQKVSEKLTIDFDSWLLALQSLHERQDL